MTDVKTKVEKVCVIKGCGQKVRARGLCDAHYTIASARVKTKATTWLTLEKFGMALPVVRRSSGESVSQFEAMLAEAKKSAK